MSPSETPYSRLTLSDEDIRQGVYKQYLGGGAKEWQRRGAFQLFFLRAIGLTPSSDLLDVGCGPLRAGEHFIRYLEDGRYYGLDSNRDFLRAANTIVAANPTLRSKRPTLRHIDEFQVAQLARRFDYVLAFSVLNHCTERERCQFFMNVPAIAHAATKIYITHAIWFAPEVIRGAALRHSNTFAHAGDIADELRMEEWGWPAEESIFPILEFRRSS